MQAMFAELAQVVQKIIVSSLTALRLSNLSKMSKADEWSLCM